MSTPQIFNQVENTRTECERKARPCSSSALPVLSKRVCLAAVQHGVLLSFTSLISLFKKDALVTFALLPTVFCSLSAAADVQVLAPLLNEPVSWSQLSDGGGLLTQAGHSEFLS